MELSEKKKQAEMLRALALQNDHYASRCQETFEKTGRPSALNQAEQHRVAAGEKRARADLLEHGSS